MGDDVSPVAPPDGAGANGSEPANSHVIEPNILVDYLQTIAEVTLGATLGELNDEGSFMNVQVLKDTQERCQYFANASSNVLYIHKVVKSRDEDTSIDVGLDKIAHFTFSYKLTMEMETSKDVFASLIFLKGPGPITPDRAVQSQVFVTNLPGQAIFDAAKGRKSAAFEIMHSHIHNALAPFFDANTQQANDESERAAIDTKTGISATRKSLKDLEVNLMNLNKGMRVFLSVHPRVVDAVKRGAAPETELVLHDSKLLNALQAQVSGWLRDIHAVTAEVMDETSTNSSQELSFSASDEINYWLSMEATLSSIGEQMRRPEITFTLKILSVNKRLGPAWSFTSDTGVKEAMDRVLNYNSLMHDFPLRDLLHAMSLKDVQTALGRIFMHLTKKLRVCMYPVRRALPLVVAITADLDATLRRLVPGTELSNLDYKDFKDRMAQCTEIFKAFEDYGKDFTNVAREATRRRAERFIPLKINKKHADLEGRLKYLNSFRDDHEQLRQTIDNVLRGAVIEAIGDTDPVKEVELAWQELRGVDLLDATEQGRTRWVRAEEKYNERTTRVETAIISQLRDQLVKASSANEMFRIFSKFNALLVRPKIRNAIVGYQTQLMVYVKEAILGLQQRAKVQYVKSDAHRMSQLRDLQRVSGGIIWTLQIEHKLDEYMQKVQDVLGENWKLQIDGQEVYLMAENFKKILRVHHSFERWRHEMQGPNKPTIVGPLFRIEYAISAWKLDVDFDEHVITLFKETRNLLWQNFSVPHSIQNVATDAKRVYPYAIGLKESVRTLTQTLEHINAMEENERVLLASSRNQVVEQIRNGVSLRWEFFVSKPESFMESRDRSESSTATGESPHGRWTRTFFSIVTELHSRTWTLKERSRTASQALSDLNNCQYDAQAFGDRLKAIQDVIDDLRGRHFVNLDVWVSDLNNKVHNILQARLRQAIQEWVEAFEQEIPTSEHRKIVNGPRAEQVHELNQVNQAIYLDPPLESAREQWHLQLHEWVGVVCGLEQLQADVYEQRSTPDDRATRFDDLTGSCAGLLADAYLSIDRKLRDVDGYVGKWLGFQSLWALDMNLVEREMEPNAKGDLMDKRLENWSDLLRDIRKNRQTFDTNDTSHSFGHIVIDYDQVHVKISRMYDDLQRQIRDRFATILKENMAEVHDAIEGARTKLERITVNHFGSATKEEVVPFVQTILNCEEKKTEWDKVIGIFKHGETLLLTLRWRFDPNTWTVRYSQIDDTWKAFGEQLKRRRAKLDENAEMIKDIVTRSGAEIRGEIERLRAKWDSDRELESSDETSMLNGHSDNLKRLRNEIMMLHTAQKALKLECTDTEWLEQLEEQVVERQQLSGALSPFRTKIIALRKTRWLDVQPTTIRQELRQQKSGMNQLASKWRGYKTFQELLRKIDEYRTTLNETSVIVALRSDAISDSHWDEVFKRANRTRPKDLTLGDVWELPLQVTDKAIRDVISRAQGEYALKKYLAEDKEKWNTYELDLTTSTKGTRLIRGWDELLEQLQDSINGLQAMHHSPHMTKEMRTETQTWEARLDKIYKILHPWMDVQRQYVYLEGVFKGNAEIHVLLPGEANRFARNEKAFTGLINRVTASPKVDVVLDIEGCDKEIDTLQKSLNRLQKALGEYLEKERMSFPRFYFVGDEDLLEMIGNSSDATRISKHFQKMFAGISGIVIKDDDIILGFESKEAETVYLRREISLAKTPRINDWLTLLEQGMKATLAELLAEAIDAFRPLFAPDRLTVDTLSQFMKAFPSQIVVLTTQAVWTAAVEESLKAGGKELGQIFDLEARLLRLLADMVLGDIADLQRKKCEQLITECVHQRGVIEKLANANATSPGHHIWLLQMRYVYTPDGDFLQRLQVKMANASLCYGFEYLGVPDRLVRTPLTDRCFLTLTQGLCQRLGGSPYGPAGTGKTESVKALGLQLGRFTLVFCCDDTFDFVAMGRIFLGICRVGAWGCFDEFNRLEERILSAVSQQIQNIQIGLKQGVFDSTSRIELAGRQLRVNDNTGIFITMNPGYAGRSNLPDNLKKLFRSVAMSKPDKELIAEVMLYSQGFTQAKHLSKQTVPFFDQCANRLSKQAHYDFGLRALKSVLVSSGGLKRARLRIDEGATGDEQIVEPQILVQSIRETIAPKLIKSDVDIMEDIERESFPGVDYVPADMRNLEDAIRTLAEQRHLVVSENWLKKVLQLYQIQKINHGVMMVGDSGTGKSAAWRLLLDAMHIAEGRKGVSDIIDSKVMSKEALYGKLDSTTREWTDGLFTSILRKVINNFQNEQSKTHWIVFDGDVDPEWVENLNSVLDDNKLLTLPNGERLSLPANVRIMFEVENLKYATLATVSRCGMVWFSEDTVSPMMLVRNYLGSLRSKPFRDVTSKTQAAISAENILTVQTAVANHLDTSLTESFISEALRHAEGYNHIMVFSASRALMTLFSLLNKAVRDIIEHNVDTGLPLKDELMDDYMSKKFTLAVVWALTGDCPLDDRNAFGNQLRGLPGISSPPTDGTNSAIDFKVRELPQTEWESWQAKVPRTEMMPDAIIKGDVVVPTVDTLRHEDVLYSWLAEHKPLLLCGPPGSGKTMTLFAALRKLSSLDPIGLNFSSSTTPELLIQTLEQNCELKAVNQKQVLAPKQLGRWIVIFCDEINLPAPDKYGTQRAISFLRQLVEHNGFWRTADKVWITLERIQFVGACNPPADAGRTPLGARFLRHAPLIMVGYPGELSLKQIYGAYNDAALKVAPSLRGFAQPLTDAMVRFYLESQQRFTPQIQPHYIYSPRELTRWVRGVFEAIKPAENEGAFGMVPVGLNRLVRIWAHEALRLFRDRLVHDEERQWTDDAVKRVAGQFFGGINHQEALGYPILFSDWLTKAYEPVEQDKLRDYVQNRLRQFGDEVMDVPLVPFDDVLEHALRIARVFRQPQGHLILIGVSGSGKTTLARLVSWMEGMTVYQIKVSRKYTGAHFDMDLRNVLRLCGCEDRRTCFILDEANVLDSGFLERMNTLLANAEIPGLFEGDELTSLLATCRDAATAATPPLDLETEEEVFRWFRNRIIKNLHVVFTMNPPEGGLASRAAASPALFNRCVLNWMGDWSNQTFFQVGSALTSSIDLVNPEFEAPETMPIMYSSMRFPPSFKEAVINAMVYIHDSLRKFNTKLLKQQDKITFLTPRHFLDFVKHFERLSAEKRNDLQEQQLHLNVGVDKLDQTFNQVRELRTMLDKKKKQLEIKQAEADAKLAELTDQKSAAKQNQEEGEKLKVEIEERRKNIAIQKSQVEEELEEAEPAVEEAKNSVSSIKRQHLGELRTMKAPPVGIRKTMEAVCMLLGKNVKEWKDVCSVMRGDDFIVSIVAFDQQQNLTKALRTKLRNEFLELPEYSYEKIEFASKACGPLVKWLNAQVNYAEILEKIGPLRHKVGALEAESEKSEQKAAENKAKLEFFEQKIETYNKEFASLVREVEGIKTEMQTVEAKVSRSEQLLRNLSSEKARWGESRESFEDQKKTLVGDTLVAAAFLAYGGLYDQTFRKSMMDDWLHHLGLSGVKYQTSNPITEYLSTAQDRMKWQSRSLPVDDLCTENAIVLKRYNRYPLIIDPSGQITSFLEKECLANERRLTVTSFLDDGFDKKVETAMRFGLPILIQDAEHMDPMLNPVLNREYERTGGRVLVQVGASQIDYSDKFDLYLMTRDPSVTFPPDVCSRMTFVNFTVTQSSLQMQSLSNVLKAERPDVDQQRSDLIKAQGEFKVELRGLEDELLRALSESQGNILDNDAVLKSLEDLKEKAGVVAKKMSNAEGIMAVVEQKTQGYRVVARSCSAVFSVLEQLHYLNHFYQFSLQYFLDIFHSVLDENKKLASSLKGDASDDKIYDERRDRIVKNLFVATFTRTAPGLLQKDRIALAILLAQASPYKMDRGLIDVILSKFVEGTDVSPNLEVRKEAFARAARIDAIKEKIDGVSDADWDTFFSEESAENFVPKMWEDSTEPRDQALIRLLLVKLFRLDRFVPAAQQFATLVFGPGLFDFADDLEHVLGQVSPSQPIALVSTPGFDASYKVDHLVQRANAICNNIAMGSNESAASANQALSSAAQTGSWVLIKNVHLAPAWLQALEKKMQGLTPHPQFRLFLSMESSPKIPINLLRASRVLMYEQPAGIRANMKDSMSSLATRAVKAPVERARLYLLLCFLHAVVQERLRYAPTLGWKGFWEFNDSDYECSAFIIDRWIESVASTRTNIGPAEIPWVMIRSLVTEMYGGKIDSETDFGILRTLVETTMTPAAYDVNHKLVEGEDDESSLVVPSGTTLADFNAWVHGLPEREPPTYLGLPANAEKILLVDMGKNLIGDLQRVVELLDEGEQVMADE